MSILGDFPKMLKSRIEIHGRTTCAHYWYERMISSPDVLYTVKGYELDINEELNTGVLSVHFCLSGTRFVQLEEPEILAPVIIDHDDINDKPVYKLGEIVNDNSLQVRQSKQDTVQAEGAAGEAEKRSHQEDFSSTSTDLDLTTIILPSSLSSASASNNRHRQEREEGPMRTSSSNDFEHRPAITTTSRSNAATIAALVGDDDEFAALKPTTPSQQAAPILSMDRPKQGVKMTLSHYCFDGFVKMHFDSDSLVYFNEFRLHNPGGSGDGSSSSSGK